MITPEKLKSEAPALILKYANSSNTKGFMQIANTLIPFFILFYLALASFTVSYWYAVGFIFLIALFILRIFMMMHDCGHNALFRTKLLNQIFGFFTGVFCGMPQFVWAQHHNFHHSTNGNWSKYRGPLSTLSINEYSQLSPAGKKTYQRTRNILFSPVGAFMYFIFNPRFNWALGTVKFISYLVMTKVKNIRTPIKTIAGDYSSRYWKNATEYWHMCGNNIVLLGLWAVLIWTFGPAAFFTVYIASLCLAGAAGIIIFTIQHNFEASYASDDEHWSYYQAALEGTSFLKFSKIANWFTADIAYHHIHHLSARIPNYNLAKCHQEYASWFTAVKQIRLSDIPNAFKYILWDTVNYKIISINQFNQMNMSNDQGDSPLKVA